MSWERDAIGNYCEITSSKRIFFSEYVESGVPFYRSKEIIEREEGKEIGEPLFISEEKYSQIKQQFGVPCAGDMLLTSVGTIGIPYIVKHEDRFYFKDGNLTWFRKFDSRLSSRYLYYWIKSSDGYGVLNNTTIGSSQKALTIAALKKIEIPLPPISTQLRIVEILSAYDDLIENNQKQIKLLEEAAQRLYKEWFVDLRFPGYEHTPVVDGVPEGWRIEEIGRIADINPGSISKDYPYQNIQYVDLSSVRCGLITDKSSYSVNNAPGRARRIARDGDIIWGMVRPNLKPYALVIDPEENDVFSTGFAVLSAKMVPFSFLYCATITEAFISYLVNCTNGAAYPAVKPEHFAKAKVLVGDDKTLKAFCDTIEPILREIHMIAKQNKRTEALRDLLLPKLMGGEIEV